MGKIQYINTNCANCNTFITVGKSEPKLCEKCKDIILNVNCTYCNKPIQIKSYKLVKYLQSDNKFIYCGHSCCLKHIHQQNDGIRYCEICKEDTMHMIGIGCMSCYNRDEGHKQSIVNTVKERYGDEYTNVYQVPKVKEKIARESLRKYGTTNPGDNREARIKANRTMRGNGNGSSCEDYFEDALKRLNIEYKKQYKDERYPFLCDFYLVESDTFIELNIYWSHNDHFFDSNNPRDLEVLESWKSKADNGHRQYANAVNVWSNKDLEKRKYAIKNNLNYRIIWNYDDIDKFIDSLMEVL